MQTLSNLRRKDIRYWCFRLQTESTGGPSTEGIPEGLKDHFENLPWFQGWNKYGVTWDVGTENPLEMTPLKKSLEDSWNAIAFASAKDYPISQ